MVALGYNYVTLSIQFRKTHTVRANYNMIRQTTFRLIIKHGNIKKSIILGKQVCVPM